MTTISNSVVSQRPITTLDNDSYIKKAESAPLKSQEITQSTATPVFVDSAAKNVVSAASLKDTAPDIVPSPVQADPEAFTKQVSQALGSISNLTQSEASKAMEQMNDSLVVLANKSGFDISTIANGFSGKAAQVLQTICLAAQYNQSIMREQSSANNMMARSLGEMSSKQIVQAGIENKAMVDKQAGISLATTAVSGGIQTKALTKSNQAIQVHGSKSINLKRDSDALSASAVPGSRSRLDKMTSQDASDIKLLKKESNRLKHDSSAENLQQQLRANDASKLQMQGMMFGQGGQAVANLSSSNGHVDKANAEANAQLLKTDENVFTSRKESDEREQQAIGQFKAELMQLLNQILANRAGTVRAMTANLKA